MTRRSIERHLSQLEELKLRFDRDSAADLNRTLAQLEKARFTEVESLIRFHEALLFLRAHPHNKTILRKANSLLASFGERVKSLAKTGADLTALDYIEYSGIASTTVIGHFSYDIARWLVSRFGPAVDVCWERHERKDRLGPTLPRFLPLLEEDSLVEANIPYLEWLHAAKPPRENYLAFLTERFERLPRSDREKGELYDSLELWVQWRLGKTRASRTRNVRTPRRVYFHRGPFIQRRDVSLAREIIVPLSVERLAERDGLAIIDMLRATTTVRYRELYGITHGDPRSVVRADAGRGVQIFLWGLPPERRLPLRAYHLGFTLKNGVPVNYIEGIALVGRMEVGFNTFYTFRDGESAWVYAQVLRLLHQRGAAECFSIDPYQLGFNNEEAIESGAFWFYRKLGFRPANAGIRELMDREETKIAGRPGYRTSAPILRKLAAWNALYEIDPSRKGEWDRFQVRNLGLAVQRRMAGEFSGDASKIREASTATVVDSLGVSEGVFTELERIALGNLALVLAMIPDLDQWTADEKRDVVRVIRAKVSSNEARFSRLMQRHQKLRNAILGLGSE